jgi:hypothetical protein
MRANHLLFLLIASGTGIAQQTSTSAGISPDWDVKANMSTLVADVKRLEPVLQRVKPDAWIEKGAPEAYIRQLQSSQASLESLIRSTAALAKDPDRLTVALDTFFRMEKMELLLGSLKEGVRRYQNPEVADEFTSLLASNSVHRDRLRQHITDLASAREQEFKVIDSEAQRCRGMLSRQGVDSKVEPRKNRKQEKK